MASSCREGRVIKKRDVWDTVTEELIVLRISNQRVKLEFLPTKFVFACKNKLFCLQKCQRCIFPSILFQIKLVALILVGLFFYGEDSFAIILLTVIPKMICQISPSLSIRKGVRSDKFVRMNVIRPWQSSHCEALACCVQSSSLTWHQVSHPSSRNIWATSTTASDQENSRSGGRYQLHLHQRLMRRLKMCDVTLWQPWSGMQMPTISSGGGSASRAAWTKRHRRGRSGLHWYPSMEAHNPARVTLVFKWRDSSHVIQVTACITWKWNASQVVVVAELTKVPTYAVEVSCQVYGSQSPK